MLSKRAASALKQKKKVPGWDFETICQNIRAPRSVGVQQKKSSGTRITEQTVDTTTNEGSKTMGRGFLSRGPPPLHLSFWEGCYEAGGEALFSRVSPMEPIPRNCRHQGRLWCHCSPLGNETCHTQGAMWSSLSPPLSVVFFFFSLRSPTRYLCKQRLCLL